MSVLFWRVVAFDEAKSRAPLAHITTNDFSGSDHSTTVPQPVRGW